MIKKTLTILLFILFVFITTLTYNDSALAQQDFSYNNKISLKIGESLNLKTLFIWVDNSLVKENELYGEWNSTNKNVATVDSKGIIRGLNKGFSKITFNYIHGNISYKINIDAEVQESVLGITLNQSYKELSVGEKYKLKYNYIPLNAFNEELEWSTSNSNIVKVSKDGEITAMSKGEAFITLSTKYSKHTAICKVKINGMVKSIELNVYELNLKKGDTRDIIATIYPINSINKDIDWITTNSNVVKVSKGKVTAVGQGSAFVIAKTVDGGFEKQCAITVNEGVQIEDIKLKSKEITIYAGEKHKIDYEIIPKNANSNDVKITASKPDSKNNIVAIEKDYVIGISQGVSIITIESMSGKINNSMIVKVLPYTKSITLNKKIETLYIGETKTLKANLFPFSSNNLIKWSSSDSNVVKVDSKGNIKGINAGKATIVATSVDGGFSDNCEVYVGNMVKGVSFKEKSIKMGIDSTYSVKYSIFPDNAYNKNVTYQIKNENIATVDKSGNIKGKNVGETEITITTEDGGFKDTCKITVTNNLKDIIIYDNENKIISSLTNKEPIQKASIVVNGKTIKSDIEPFIENGRVLAPFRIIFEALGISVSWESKTQKVSTSGNMDVMLWINKNTAYVNGKYYTLDVPPRLVNDRTFVPVRFIAENMNFEVKWDDYTKTVIINSRVSP